MADLSANPYKRLDRPDCVLSTSNKGVVTSIDGLVESALLVSGRSPAKAIAFLTRTGADRDDPVMGKVFQTLEGMISHD